MLFCFKVLRNINLTSRAYSCVQSSRLVFKKQPNPPLIECSRLKKSTLFNFNNNLNKYETNTSFSRLFSSSSSSLSINKPNLTRGKQRPDEGKKNALWYILSGLVIMIGASYAAVPLFKIFCESQGIDVSTEFKDMDIEKLKKKLSSMKKVEDRAIKVEFVASTASDLLWKFEPCQDEIVVAPGETALAFFRAKNLTDRSIIGIGI